MFPGMIQVSFAEFHKSFLPGSHVRNERGEVRTGNMIFRVLAGESSLRPRVGADT